MFEEENIEIITFYFLLKLLQELEKWLQSSWKLGCQLIESKSNPQCKYNVSKTENKRILKYIFKKGQQSFTRSNTEVATKFYRYTTAINSATKIIFIRNLHHNITNSVLRTHFMRFGIITNIEIDVTGVFGFVEYKNKHSAINAIRELNGKMLKEHRLHLDYGTIKAARCLLINGISKSISEQSLVGCVNRSLSNAKIGRVRSCLMDEIKGSALLFFECDIIKAYNTLCEFFNINNIDLEVDFASDSCMFNFGDSPDITSFKANTEVDQDRIINYSINEQRFTRNFHNTPSSSTANIDPIRMRCIRVIPLTQLMTHSNAVTSDAPTSSHHTHFSNFCEPLDLRVHEPNSLAENDTVRYPCPTLFEGSSWNTTQIGLTQDTKNNIILNTDQRDEYAGLTESQHFQTNSPSTADNSSSTMWNKNVKEIKTEKNDISVDFDSSEPFVKYESMYDKVKSRSRKQTINLEKIIKVKIEKEEEEENKTKCGYSLRQRK